MITYSNATTKTDFSAGNLPFLRIYRTLTNLTYRFCRDLAPRLPQGWKHVQGLQKLNGNRQMELNFYNNGPMIHLQQHELHDIHTGPTEGDDGVPMVYTTRNGRDCSGRKPREIQRYKK